MLGGISTPQSVVSVQGEGYRRSLYRVLVEVRVEGQSRLSLMVPARLRDTIQAFLREVERLVAGRVTLGAPRLFVEDLYEVDPRFSVEESLGDLQRVVVTPGAAAPRPAAAPHKQPQLV